VISALFADRRNEIAGMKKEADASFSNANQKKRTKKSATH
jgi:hypothetical protein